MKLNLAAFSLMGLFALADQGTANAGSVTIDFDDVPPISATLGNFLSGGFRFSSRSYYTILAPGSIYPGSVKDQGFGGTQYFGFGRAGESCNPDFIAALYGLPTCDGSLTGGELIIDNFGQPFSIESLYGVLGVFSQFNVTSSKGGAVTIANFPDGEIPETRDFTGGDWRGVRWLRFEFGVGPTTGFDHLTLSAGVPEPGTLALFGLGLAGMGFARRRRQ